MRVGISTRGNTQVVTIGSLMVEMFDVESTSLVRQAAATDSLRRTPEKTGELINVAALGAFKGFPPRAKRKRR